MGQGRGEVGPLKKLKSLCIRIGGPNGTQKVSERWRRKGVNTSVNFTHFKNYQSNGNSLLLGSSLCNMSSKLRTESDVNPIGYFLR